MNTATEKLTEEPWECDHKPVSIGQGYNGHQLYIRSGDREITGAMGHVSILTKYATDETRKALKAQCHTVIEENEEPPYTSEMLRIVSSVNTLPIAIEALTNLISVVEQLMPEESARGVADVVLAQARSVIALDKSKGNKCITPE